MGGLSTEYIQRLQQGVGGAAQTFISLEERKRREGIRGVERAEDIGMKAAVGGFQLATAGQTPAFTAGGQSFVKTPLTKAEIEKNKLAIEKVKVSIADIKGKEARSISKTQRTAILKSITKFKKDVGTENLNPEDAKFLENQYKALGIGTKFQPGNRTFVENAKKLLNYVQNKANISGVSLLGAPVEVPDPTRKTLTGLAPKGQPTRVPTIADVPPHLQKASQIQTWLMDQGLTAEEAILWLRSNI